MRSWSKRLFRWWGGAGAQVPGPADAVAAQARPAQQQEAAGETAAAPAAGAARSDPLDLELQFFQWLTGVPAVAEAPLAGSEKLLLSHLDAVLASEDLRSQLLPRARAIVPQLLNTLRDDAQSAQSLAAHVARDPNLVVEVIRLANSVGYGADRPVVDLLQAISRLGTEGLRRAIARVLLRPIFDAQADTLLSRSAERLWQHSEMMASLCLQQASIARLDRFEAYLAGLMHNVGWSAGLRAIDRSPQGAPAVFTAAFVRAFAPRRDGLFATFVRSWELSPSLTALAEEVLAVGFENARSHLALLLVHAHRTACQELLQDATGDSAPGLA